MKMTTVVWISNRIGGMAVLVQDRSSKVYLCYSSLLFFEL